MLKYFCFAILILHGVIHLMGFLKGFRLVEFKKLTREISRPAGLFWLVTAILFILAAIALFVSKSWWWIPAAVALVFSQVFIVTSWRDARFGTIINVFILVAVMVGYGSWQFNYKSKEKLVALSQETAGAQAIILSPDMCSKLPPVIHKWLERSNVIGKEVPRHVYIEQSGRMRTKPGGNWMTSHARQWFTPLSPGFLWSARVQVAPGLFFSGLDHFQGGSGRMQIKLLSLFPIVNSKGAEVDQGSMIRYLAETVWFPAAAASGFISWEQLDDRSARAVMTYAGHQVSGIFRFDEYGDCLGFEAMRYYGSGPEATPETWSVQIFRDGYKLFEGVRIAAKSSVTWKLKDGDFTWFELEINDLRYEY